MEYGNQKGERNKDGGLKRMQKAAGGGQEYIKTDMQRAARPYQRESGIDLNQQISRQSTGQQTDGVRPFPGGEDAEEQAYKDSNREGEPSLCHICLELVIACHLSIVPRWLQVESDIGTEVFLVELDFLRVGE